MYHRKAKDIWKDYATAGLEIIALGLVVGAGLLFIWTISR